MTVQEQKELEKESDENKYRTMTMNIFHLSPIIRPRCRKEIGNSEMSKIWMM